METQRTRRAIVVTLIRIGLGTRSPPRVVGTDYSATGLQHRLCERRESRGLMADGGAIPANQVSRLRAILGPDRDLKVSKIERRFTAAGGWNDNVSVKKRAKMIGALLGGAAVATTAIAWISYEEESELFRSSMEPLLLQIERERDPLERKLTVIEAFGEIKAYMGQFLLADTALDIVFLLAIYKTLGS
mgnify:CR=1 FL=1